MIEPAALGKPVIVGPFTGNFAEAMNKFRSAEAVMEVVDEGTLVETVSVLRYSPEEAAGMGARARAVVMKEKGATLRHAEVIVGLLNNRARMKA
jgi:3-deoxy-D-manno-octulosonic-acid transferase